MSKRRRSHLHRPWDGSLAQAQAAESAYLSSLGGLSVVTKHFEGVAAGTYSGGPGSFHQSTHFLLGDVQHWAEIANVARLHYIPESLATYNIMDESASRSKDIRKTLRFKVSVAELFVYLCHKYGAPEDIRRKHEKAWRDSALRLAFHSRDSALADEVRRQALTFTLKEWLRYYGARNSMVHLIYRFGARVSALFRKEVDPWLTAMGTHPGNPEGSA